jgi:hypothetical protein
MLRIFTLLSLVLISSLPAVDEILHFRPHSDDDDLSMMGGNGSERIQLNDKGKGEWKLPGRLVRFQQTYGANKNDLFVDGNFLHVQSAPLDAQEKPGTFVKHDKSYHYQIPYLYAGETIYAQVSVHASGDTVYLWGSSAISATCSKTRIVLFDNLNGIFGEPTKSKMLISTLGEDDRRTLYRSVIPVFKIINFEGVLHNFEAVPNRPGFWRLYPYTGPLATVRLTSSATTQRCRISLVGKNGSMGAVGFAGETIQVIPGEYILSKPTIGLRSASGSLAHWVHPDYADPDTTVQVSSTGAHLNIGPPLRLVAKASRSKDQITLSDVSLLGSAQERYSTSDRVCSVTWALVRGESRQDVGKLEYG